MKADESEQTRGNGMNRLRDLREYIDALMKLGEIQPIDHA